MSKQTELMSKKINGTIVLKEQVTSAKFNVTFPANIKLKAYCDDKDRIFVESPIYKGTFVRVFKGNITESKWDESIKTNLQGVTAKSTKLITVLDPDSNNYVTLTVFKHQNGGMFAIDSLFLTQIANEDDDPVIADPFEKKFSKLTLLGI
jgi:hypothetical protein